MHFIDSKDSTIAFGNLNLGEKAGLFIQTKGDDLILGKSNCEELPQFVSKSDDLTAKSDYLVMEHRSKSDVIQF